LTWFQKLCNLLIDKLITVLNIMRKNFYEAFTLVEMLIVMGILIILMAIGITAGRFAINRANDVAHQNAVDQIYTGLEAYYTDNREFPAATNPQTLLEEAALEEDNILFNYLDQGAFNGGTESTYMYFVDATQQQTVLVCVTLGGAGDEKGRGVYCNGNGFGSEDINAAITEKTNEPGSAGYTAIQGLDADTAISDWDQGAWTSPGTAIIGGA